MLKQQIAGELEVAFSQFGFAEPSVAQLKKACSVSLRTLYKYYPSKEEMIVGALDHRHRRYIALLENELPQTPLPALMAVLDKLHSWMLDYAPTGCMSMNAISAFPENAQIVEAVAKHKKEVRVLLEQLSGSKALGTSVFLLHEGVSSAWPLLGEESVMAAKQTLTMMIK
ncbi:TetR/AcrR family transcriptional regulator [Vibrio sp. FNV 38]|nr:TetR/AcrR family transcriptional regulator [Vibrio sp. FNV 38]